jgi:cytochrome c-type biogenesis protein CcmH
MERPRSMQKYRTSALLVLMAAAILGQSSSQIQTEAVRRVGAKLACLCGCNNTVADCPMLECSFALPARRRIAALQAAGKSDAEIINEFVQQYGKRVLAVPPAEGFNLLAWVMPFVAIAAGLAIVWMFIQRFRKPQPASRPLADRETLSRYQAQIEKDLKNLD